MDSHQSNNSWLLDVKTITTTVLTTTGGTLWDAATRCRHYLESERELLFRPGIRVSDKTASRKHYIVNFHVIKEALRLAVRDCKGVFTPEVALTGPRGKPVHTRPQWRIKHKGNMLQINKRFPTQLGRP
jgi:hypothetical protein